MAPTTTAADIIFSEQAGHNFSHILSELKRSTLSVHNRLRSITTDALFVKQIGEQCQKPLIANERCGSWYIDPKSKAGSAYFKSTDGHTRVWKFSLRRLNFHLLDIIGKNNGCIIVDSTRRGKRMPDALSKTIPIWACVLNRSLFPEDTNCHELYTPPQVVSSSEHAQIHAHIPRFVQSLTELDIDMPALREKISKPLRPIWITPETSIENIAVSFEDFHPIICLTASRRVSGTEVAEGGYIQGAGDDAETFSLGLTPPIFWSNSEILLSTSEEELPEAIASLITQAKSMVVDAKLPQYIPPTSCLVISSISTLPIQPDSKTINILLSPTPTSKETWKISTKRLDIGLGANKIGSRNLRDVLPFISAFMRTSLREDSKISIACESGKDLSVGVAVAILCILFNEEGKLSFDAVAIEKRLSMIDKAFIRKRLAWIMMALPDVNPNRTTLQSVNSFLMDRR